MKNKFSSQSRLNCGYLLIFLLFIEFSLCSHAKIVFRTKRESDIYPSIYVMDDNGSNLRRITDARFWDTTPRWIPDGKRILFARDYSRGKGNVYNAEFFIIDETGLNEKRFMINHPTDKQPAISPNGKFIAFNSNRSGNWDIYTLNLETGNLKQLTDNDFPSAWSHRSAWSPDNKQIAYQHDGENDTAWNIWIMDADGKNKKRLTRNPGKDIYLIRGAPVWSPSGKYIMYDDHLFRADANRKLHPIASQLIIHNVYTGFRDIHDFPKVTGIATGCWLGNDQNVLLSMRAHGADPESDYEIYKYNLESGNLKNITNHPSNDVYPQWIEGYSSVSPMDKLTTQWGQLKEEY